MLFIQSEAGKENWASQVKQVLTRNGFGLVWLCQDVGNEREFLAELKDRMIACFKQNWHSKIEENEKYTWFYSFKNIFQPEKYLSSLTNKWHRSIFVRFRNRTLGLNGHKRWYNDKTTDNICCFCSDRNKKSVFLEDEEYFLFHCKAYDDLRSKCKVLSANVRVNLDLCSLLSTENEEVIRPLAKFIAEASAVRKRKLYS